MKVGQFAAELWVLLNHVRNPVTFLSLYPLLIPRSKGRETLKEPHLVKARREGGGELAFNEHLLRVHTGLKTSL